MACYHIYLIMIYSWNQYKYFIVNIYIIGIRKFDGLTASAPVVADCGLVVDVNHIPNMSTGNVLAPIECLVNGTTRHTPLFQNSYLQFKSRIT
jgi:hypothetical protein